MSRRVFGVIFFWNSSYRQSDSKLILQHDLFPSSLLRRGTQTRDLLLPAVTLSAFYVIYGQQGSKRRIYNKKKSFRFVIVGIIDRETEHRASKSTKG